MDEKIIVCTLTKYIIKHILINYNIWSHVWMRRLNMYINLIHNKTYFN